MSWPGNLGTRATLTQEPQRRTRDPDSLFKPFLTSNWQHFRSLTFNVESRLVVSGIKGGELAMTVRTGNDRPLG